MQIVEITVANQRSTAGALPGVISAEIATVSSRYIRTRPWAAPSAGPVDLEAELAELAQRGHQIGPRPPRPGQAAAQDAPVQLLGLHALLDRTPLQLADQLVLDLAHGQSRHSSPSNIEPNKDSNAVDARRKTGFPDSALRASSTSWRAMAKSAGNTNGPNC